MAQTGGIVETLAFGVKLGTESWGVPILVVLRASKEPGNRNEGLLPTNVTPMLSLKRQSRQGTQGSWYVVSRVSCAL